MKKNEERMTAQIKNIMNERSAYLAARYIFPFALRLGHPFLRLSKKKRKDIAGGGNHSRDAVRIAGERKRKAAKGE